MSSKKYQADNVSRRMQINSEERFTKMKINLKNVAAVLFVIGGTVGVSIAAIRNSAKSDSSSAVTMSESSMVSGLSSCEMCSNCADLQCTEGRCVPNESMMVTPSDKSMSMTGSMRPMMSGEKKMSGEKMTEGSMANTMSQAMNEKSMTPSSGSADMVDSAQMAVVPKM